MMKKIVMRSCLLVLMIFCLADCKAFGDANVPYVINGSFTKEDNIAEYEICGVDLYFLNKSDKDISNFTVVFSVFDCDGEPAVTSKNSLVFKIDEELESMESINLCLSLDKYISYVPDDNCFIDYLYVSEISYMDGTNWSDPFGLKVF